MDAIGSISLEAYGAVGPAVTFGPYVEATVRPLQDPWLVIDGGVKAGLEFVWKVHKRYTLAEADIYRYNIERRSGTFPGPVITTTELNATEGEPFEAQLEAQGGTAPLTWSAEADTLPPGLGLGSSGILAGTPTEAGFTEVVVTVTDPDGRSQQGTLGITVRPGGGGDPGGDDLLTGAVAISTSGATPAPLSRTARPGAGGATKGVNWGMGPPPSG